MRGRGLPSRLRLLALAGAALCACGPATVEMPLADVAGLELQVEHYWFMPDTISLWLQGDVGPGRCYQVPEETRVTLNGQELQRITRGGAQARTEGRPDCAPAWFVRDGTGDPAALAQEHAEFLITDGKSTARAVFANLGVERTLRVNGQDAPALSPGQAVDVEWLPATDTLRWAQAWLRREGAEAGEWQPAAAPGTQDELSGNHVGFEFAALPPGNYALAVDASIQVGVEACEGLSRCDAFMGRRVSELPVVVQ